MAHSVRIDPEHLDRSTLAGERRQVTAVFYDIVDSTSLLNSLDLEDFGHLQRRIHTVAARVIAKCGGHIDQISGDGGCAYFGYPVASEDAAECAVGAALDLVKACEEIAGDSSGRPPLRIRVGLATGTVVITSIEGAGHGREVIGIAPTLAARLQSVAPPGTVLVSESTHRLTRSAFEFRPVGPARLKGFAEPQLVWQALGRRSVDVRFQMSPRPRTRLVARVQELELCLRLWREAQRGRGTIVVVTGEAGIGKSRLVSEVLSQAGSAGCDPRVLQCQPRARARPFHALVDRIRREIRESAGGQELGAEAVRAYFGRLSPGLRAESVEILSFLILGQAPPEAGYEELSSLPSHRFAEAAVEAGYDLLSAWSRSRPQLLVIEDLQWSDALMRALLNRVAGASDGLPLMALVTSREPPAPELMRHGSVVRSNLSRLSPQDVAQMVELIWDPDAPPKGLADFVEERAEGIPLFVEELTHLLRESFETGPSDPADWKRLLKREGVITLKDLLSSRIADLGPARRTAQVASVIGREFPYELLAAVTGDQPPGMLDKHLAALVEKDLVHVTVRGEQTAFRFRHALLQEAAYDSLLRSEQRDLHSRIVTLSSTHPRCEIPDEVMAWHCEQAGRFREAAEYAIKAAESAAVRSAVQESYQLLVAAQSYIDRLEDGPEVEDLRLSLLATRGPVEMALFGSGSRQACQTYEEAVAICRAKGPQDREKWLPLYWGWWITSPNSEAVPRAQVILSDLEGTTDDETRLQVMHCSWATHYHAGHHAECLACIERGLMLYDPERAAVSRTKYGGHDAKVCALAERAQSLWFRGEFEAAAESIREALRWAEEINHLGSICHALDFALVFNHFQRNLGEVLRLAERMRALSDRHSLPNGSAKSDIFAGWARALDGDLATGMAMFERGLARQREIGTEEDLPIYLDMKSAILERAGRPHEALAVIEEALEHASRTSDAFWLPELYRRRAVLGEACGRPATRVREDLEAALSLACIQGADALARRIAHDLEAQSPGARLSKA